MLDPSIRSQSQATPGFSTLAIRDWIRVGPKQNARDPELARRIQDTLAETLPSAAGVLVPRGYQLGDEYEYLGYSSQSMNEFAFTALSRRLKVIGVGLPAVAG